MNARVCRERANLIDPSFLKQLERIAWSIFKRFSELCIAQRVAMKYNSSKLCSLLLLRGFGRSRTPAAVSSGRASVEVDAIQIACKLRASRQRVERVDLIFAIR